MKSGTTETKRKKLVKLIHTGKGKMALTDDAYRAFLEGTTGKQSCADMSVRQLEAVLRAMRRNGFEQKPCRVRPEEQGAATMAQVEYIKGMWEKCARNKSDEALNKMIKRIAAVDSIRFLNISGARKVILALRDMMVRAGYDPDTSGEINGQVQKP